MSDTFKYKTKSEIVPVAMPFLKSGPGIIALDGGYSALKGISQTRAFIIPSYAKRIDGDLEAVGAADATAVILHDLTTGQYWAVGSLAEELMTKRDMEETTDAYLFGRYRYKTDVFKAIMTTGLGMGLTDVPYTGGVFLQTGLPSLYKEDDEDELVDALAGGYDFELKVGDGGFKRFAFKLDKRNIGVMEQPQGTLSSVIYGDDGRPAGEDSLKMLSENVIVYDAGFSTEDLFVIRGGFKESHKTYQDTGMRAVFEDVIQTVNKTCHTGIKVFELQKYLKDGKISYFDRESRSERLVPFADLLEDASKRVCAKSINRLMQEYDDLLEYRYLIVTGGTGESRLPWIKEELSGLSRLTVLPGNVNHPDLPCAFSNARGYYLFRYNALARAGK